MYFSRRKLWLLILVLAQIVDTLGQSDECAVQTISEETPKKGENLDVCTIENRIGEEQTKVEESTALNVTVTNNSNFIVNCLTDEVYGAVEIVNETRLIELLILEPVRSNRTRNDKESRLLPGKCILILFYARWCIFSSQAAPSFNALPRIFPSIQVIAIDAMKHQRFNAQYGIVGVPTIMLFHNGKSVAKFNGTVYSLEDFAIFIMQLTNLEPRGLLFATLSELNGPVSSMPSNETDYCLVLSWVFIAACALYFTSQSRWWQQFVELVQNTWRESNAQHEHTD